jgi:hypothetical protein
MRQRAVLALVCGILFVSPAWGDGLQHSRSMLRPRAARPLPRPHVMELARQAFRCARGRDEIQRPVLTVIDYSLPSVVPRLWVIDMISERVMFHELVAHGRNSGEGRATAFSNVAGSKQSSLGLFRAEETYEGKHGYSLRMAGLEPGINDNARDRAIVIHGADYVSPSFVSQHGRLGRSWGCPALPREVSQRVIDAIRDGGAVFSYYPDEDWLRASEYLRCEPSTRLTSLDSEQPASAR